MTEYQMNKNAYNGLSTQTGGKVKKLKNKSKNKRAMNEKKVMPTYIEHLSEPWFSLISLGLKTVEGRKNKGKFKDMRIGETIEWVNEDFNKRTVLTEIIGKREYKKFDEFLTKEGLDRCLPGIKTIDVGLSVYYKYFTKEDEERYGVMAIELRVLE